MVKVDLKLGNNVIFQYEKGKENHTLTAITEDGEVLDVGEGFDKEGIVSITLNSIVTNEEGYRLQNTATIPTSFIKRGVDLNDYFAESVELMRLFLIEPIADIIEFEMGFKIRESKIIDIKELGRVVTNSAGPEFMRYVNLLDIIYKEKVGEVLKDFEERKEVEERQSTREILEQFIHEMKDDKLREVFIIKDSEGKNKVRMVNNEGIFLDIVEGDNPHMTNPMIVDNDTAKYTIPSIYYLISIRGRDMEEVFKELPNPIRYLTKK